MARYGYEEEWHLGLAQVASAVCVAAYEHLAAHMRSALIGCMQVPGEAHVQA